MLTKISNNPVILYWTWLLKSYIPKNPNSEKYLIKKTRFAFPIKVKEKVKLQASVQLLTIRDHIYYFKLNFLHFTNTELLIVFLSRFTILSRIFWFIDFSQLFNSFYSRFYISVTGIPVNSDLAIFNNTFEIPGIYNASCRHEFS